MLYCYGIIAVRHLGKKWETLLVKHQKGHWAFPKGHAEGGETPQESAMREFHEETGLNVIRLLEHPPLEEHYTFLADEKLQKKTVRYFLAEVEGHLHVQTTEIADACWLSLKEAVEKATFAETKALCKQLLALHDTLTKNVRT